MTSLAWVLGAAACRPADEGPEYVRETVEPGVVHGAPAHRDTGPEGDSAPADDTSEELFDCHATDLAFTVEVRNDQGEPTDTFGPDDLPTLAAYVTNTCEGRYDFETETNCLVKEWDIAFPDGSDREVLPLCSSVTTYWDLAGGESVESTYKLEALAPGRYVVHVRFGFHGATGETAFLVTGLP